MQSNIYLPNSLDIIFNLDYNTTLSVNTWGAADLRRSLKNNMRNIFLPLFCTILLSSCNNKAREKTSNGDDKAAVYDEVCQIIIKFKKGDYTFTLHMPIRERLYKEHVNPSVGYRLEFASKLPKPETTNAK